MVRPEFPVIPLGVVGVVDVIGTQTLGGIVSSCLIGVSLAFAWALGIRKS